MTGTSDALGEGYTTRGCSYRDTGENEGYIFSTNGIATDDFPSEVGGIAPVDGVVTFALNSYATDSTIPVVWTSTVTPSTPS